MTTLRENEHNWTWLPELGSDYSYCDRCDRVMVNETGEIITYRQAMQRTEPSTKAAAAALGRKGGKSTSAAKRAAVRENGKKGGRPRKTQAPE